jgi:CRP-like cAMP-binding protein
MTGPRPSSTVPIRPLNRLLGRLPPDELERVRPHLTTVSMQSRQVLHKQNEQIERVYFPNGGVASVIIATANGHWVEVATVGVEGMVGIGAFFGSQLGRTETIMQIPDTNAEAMSAADFRAHMLRHGDLFESVNRYAQGFVGLIMQSTACMALHHVQERCCRWLLMSHDRVGRDQFELSHEFLAMMLGTSRPTVSLVASTLQQAGLIRYTYGRITVTDRPGLEAAACECYATTRDLFEELGL